MCASRIFLSVHALFICRMLYLAVLLHVIASPHPLNSLPSFPAMAQSTLTTPSLGRTSRPPRPAGLEHPPSFVLVLLNARCTLLSGGLLLPLWTSHAQRCVCSSFHVGMHPRTARFSLIHMSMSSTTCRADICASYVPAPTLRLFLIHLLAFWHDKDLSSHLTSPRLLCFWSQISGV